MQRKTLGFLGALLLLLCILFGMLSLHYLPQTTDGHKSIAIVVVHGDGTGKTFSYQTNAAYLGEVLEEQALASGTDSIYGTFITTVDGETADSNQQEWWCITKNGEMLSTSADQTPIANQEQYELTLKEGY